MRNSKWLRWPGHTTDTKKQLRYIGALLGPAFVAAVAYVDPGNFAANFSAGAQYGYTLLWVLVLANGMAVCVQYLSAKVGIVTGANIPELVARRLGRKSRISYWLQAELVAIATDLAEVIGGAVALAMLFGVPLIVGGVITGVVSLLLLLIYSRREQKIFERVIIGLLLIIPIGFIAGLIMEPPRVDQMAAGLIPHLEDHGAVTLATAMLGATIMPHVVYLHSELSRRRYIHVPRHRIQSLLKATKIDVGLAMLLAGGVNIAMLLLAAQVFSLHPGTTDTLEGIFHGIETMITPFVATLFAVGLLVASFTSTAVGTQAGDVIMRGLLHRHIKPVVRRIIVIIPALIILACGINPTFVLILSQIALSFGVPFALIPLAMLTSSQKVMGRHRNGRLMTGIIYSIAGLVGGLNIVLIVTTVFV